MARELKSEVTCLSEIRVPGKYHTKPLVDLEASDSSEVEVTLSDQIAASSNHLKVNF
jgi:hypothetical protein